ncbi:phosphatase [Streptomyces sp. TLI_171]|uniref:phosphatase n=1 Tax=Streptomyces sp. TLI_171 TaxID=1938859 RepID=UPI000C1A5FB5|nr:phosphatase [Streptomyces sp. TLI_171]RKE19722.1 histidinol phosphate phosphatase hisN-like protein [Streptomyces sp. TLI_171]
MNAREELRAHLLKHRLAGPEVPTPRQNNLRHYRLFAQADPRSLMGLEPEPRRDEAAVLRLMVERVGVNPDPRHLEGPDSIDPELALAALDRLAELVRRTADKRGSVLAGTGHPTKLAGFHNALAGALEAAGCTVHTPARGVRFREPTPEGERPRYLDLVDRVVVMRALDGPERPGRPGPGDLAHTHSPLPVRLALTALADAGHRPPDLVLGDHGWLCGAGRLGIPAGGIADCNDVAPFAAEAAGLVEVVVPLEDGSAPDCYRPLSDYVLQRADLAPYNS